jgi:hypothetical protein
LQNKGLATPINPPTHPLFAYRHPSKTKSSYLQPLENSSLSSNPNIPFPSYNPLSAFPLSPYPISYVSSFSSRLITPTISEFLKQVDEDEGTNDYYQSFLTKLEEQRISVRILSKLSDEEFEKCGVNTIGARQTIRDYAIRYNNVTPYIQSLQGTPHALVGISFKNLLKYLILMTD